MKTYVLYCINMYSFWDFSIQDFSIFRSIDSEMLINEKKFMIISTLSWIFFFGMFTNLVPKL